jgi:hypothetical protein
MIVAISSYLALFSVANGVRSDFLIFTSLRVVLHVELCCAEEEDRRVHTAIFTLVQGQFFLMLATVILRSFLNLQVAFLTPGIVNSCLSERSQGHI